MPSSACLSSCIAVYVSQVHASRFVILLQVRDLIYREILEYHPHMLEDYLSGSYKQPNFMYPSAIDNFKRAFAHAETPGARGMPMSAIGQVTPLVSSSPYFPAKFALSILYILGESRLVSISLSDQWSAASQAMMNCLLQ